MLYFSLLPRDLWLLVTRCYFANLLQEATAFHSVWERSIAVPTAVAKSKSTPHYLISDDSVVLPVLPEGVPTHIYLEAINLKSAERLWNSSQIKLCHPPLLGRLKDGEIVAAYYTELELFKPPQVEACAKHTINARSNNMPLFLDTAGSCIYTMMSVAENDKSKQPPFGGCWFALIETVVRAEVNWSLSSQIVLHTGSAALDLVAANTYFGPVCAVVMHERAVLVQIYFSQEKQTRQVTLPSSRGEHLLPSLLLHRGNLFLSYDGKVLMYDLGDLAAPVKEMEVFPRQSFEKENSLDKKDERCVTMRLDGDRLMCMGVRQNCLVSLHTIEIDSWTQQLCNFTCRRNEFAFQWIAEQSGSDLRCYFTDSAVFLLDGHNVIRLRPALGYTDDKPERTPVVELQKPVRDHMFNTEKSFIQINWMVVRDTFILVHHSAGDDGKLHLYSSGSGDGASR